MSARVDQRVPRFEVVAVVADDGFEKIGVSDCTADRREGGDAMWPTREGVASHIVEPAQ